MADVALGYDDLESYDSAVDRPYFGAVVGRVANRIANARFEVRDENGSVVTRSDALVANNGPHCLHGGTRGSTVTGGRSRRDRKTAPGVG